MDTKSINVYGKCREPSKIPVTKLFVNCRSLVRSPRYGLGEGHDTLHLVLLGQVGGVDEDRVGRLNRLGRIFRVAMHDRIGLRGNFVFGRVPIEPLNEAAARPLPWVGDEKDLELGVREHDGADVPPVDDHVARARSPSLEPAASWRRGRRAW